MSGEPEINNPDEMVGLGVVLFDGGGGFVGDDEGFSREVLI
jgi:hypothetical protein